MKDEKLKPYEEYFSKPAKEFDVIKFTHIKKRKKNQFANALVNLASMAKIDYGNRVQPINIEVRNSSAHYCLIE